MEWEYCSALPGCRAVLSKKPEVQRAGLTAAVTQCKTRLGNSEAVGRQECENLSH